MQPIRQLLSTINTLATPKACLFTLADLRCALPDLSGAAFKTLLSRAAREGYLGRVCRGLYVYEPAKPDRGRVLYHAVSKLRPLALNYLSLESTLSDAGVISQMPINRITVMSSGRSNTVDCGNWGSIEFVRTRQKPDDLTGQLHYDADCRLWRASVAQSLRDMKATRRNLDLIDWSAAREFI
ncbi:MAG: type IV toxin-antitoxin system AbiEi family antitoxin [Methylococcaceae bacterium]